LLRAYSLMMIKTRRKSVGLRGHKVMCLKPLKIREEMLTGLWVYTGL
jgi:hypothetical protein